MIYEVTHRTVYAYDDDVSTSHGKTHLLPRAFAAQDVLSSSVAIDPFPDDRHRWTDVHGNHAECFAIHHPHRRLEVTATSTVRVHPRADPGMLPTATTAETVRAARANALASTDDVEIDLDVAEFVLPSPLVPTTAALADFARPHLADDRPLLDGLRSLLHHVHTAFEFVPGATDVTTRVDEVLAERKGVCQDFAHVMIAGLRSLGLPARYVSGYLETVPPPGEPRLEGADVSHAWVSAWVPDLGWLDLDPTNDQLVDEHYVTTAWGRDFGDVTPLKGVIFTDGTTEELVVTVDVRRQDEP